MTYRGPGHMIWLPPSLVSMLSLILNLPVYRRSSLLTHDGEGGGWEAREKAWSSINHSILSGGYVIVCA
jgi:hypothetical protein